MKNTFDYNFQRAQPVTRTARAKFPSCTTNGFLKSHVTFLRLPKTHEDCEDTIRQTNKENILWYAILTLVLLICLDRRCTKFFLSRYSPRNCAKLYCYFTRELIYVAKINLHLSKSEHVNLVQSVLNGKVKPFSL